MSGLYVFKNALGYYYDIYLWFVISYILFLIKWLVAYKCGYRSYIKQVIISYEFCQHFHCLEVVLVSWMILWYLDILACIFGF